MRFVSSRSLALVFAATFAAALSGCATSGTSGSGGTAIPLTVSTFGGRVHGGNQPVTGATVKLWAAGTSTGYGAGATLIATTTTDGTGAFSFNTAGVSPCTIGQYLYVTAVGGNTGAGTNSFSAMMAALPKPCSATTGSTFVWINEVTTVAAVSSLQQFMSINTSGSPAWQIGAPSTNVTGLANAFLTSSNLASITTGSSATSSTSNTLSAVLSGTTYTTTVNPDFAKINTLADILAFCVNSAGSTCSSLFVDVTPGSSAAPIDTIQAAYYLATNAAGLTMPAHGDTQGSPYYLCATYAAASPPFMPTLTCSTSSYPTDWLIGVQFTTVNATTSAVVGTANPGSVAIDGSGNVWTATYNASTTGGSVVEFNPVGQVMLPPVTTTTVSTTAGAFPAGWTGPSVYTLGSGKPNALAIDTNNNVWFADFYGVASTDSLNTYGTASGSTSVPIAQITPQGVSTGYLVGIDPGVPAIDGNNNVFFSNIADGGNGSQRNYISELSASATPAYSQYYPGAARNSNYYSSLTVDNNQNVTGFYETCLSDAYQVNNASESAIGGTGTLPTTNIDGTILIADSTTSAPTTCGFNGAPDIAANYWATQGTYLEYINLAAGTSSGTAPATITDSPVFTSFAAGTGLTQGGLSVPKGVSIDGFGNVWVANSVSGASGGISAFVPTTASGTTTIAALSPVGASTPVYGFGSAYNMINPAQPVIDGSGNVWITSSATSAASIYLWELVGAAGPVTTPTSVLVKNAAVGKRP